MRRFLLFILMTCVVASLQAITINWQMYASEYTWDQSLSADSIYFVYSESGPLTAEQIATGSYDGYKVGLADDGITTTVSPNGTQGASDVNATLSVVGVGNTDTTKSTASLTLGGTGFGSGYYYLVVFDSTDDTNATYAVSQAVQYTGNAATDKANGIYTTTVNGKDPDYGDYVEIRWMGGTWTAAMVPEPTALALLALGIAGLALRRKV